MTVGADLKKFVEEHLKEGSTINEIRAKGLYAFKNPSKFKNGEKISVTYKNKKYSAQILNNNGFIAASDEIKFKNDISWISLFTRHDILKKVDDTGFFIVKSKQINAFRESRLMTNFDHRNNLPIIFQKNCLNILPIKRGYYIIARFEAYQKVEYSKDINPIQIEKRGDLESLDYENIYSESSALNCAFASGIMQNVIGEECVLTVNGRMSSKSFSFKIKGYKKKIRVKDSQCEIDAGFESENKLALIEAKNTYCEDFLIRQIYYPFRLWKEKISKDVVPIFMTYSNDKFSFFIYKFEDPNDYNSLCLVEQKDYVISPDPINIEDIKRILFEVKIIGEPKVPFPQADKFRIIIDLLSLLVEKDLSKEDITQNYDFDKRQTDYYFNGVKYLGLVEKYTDNGDVITKRDIIRLRLTDRGRKIMMKSHKEKNLALVSGILEHKPFKLALEYYFEKSEPPPNEKIVGFMKQSKLYNVGSNSTYLRRSQTILKWIDWIIGISEE